MLSLFTGANPELWQSRSRSIRIAGVVTSIRLENIFWRTLEGIAAEYKVSLPNFVGRLYEESLEAGHDKNNFTSFLRVSAMYYTLKENPKEPLPDQILSQGTLWSRDK
ncbi:MAG: ribbon-helix-helix domain-containing protein [Proteobacteria bacterium]|nr:ribbon-helix-helix domain-containing protein [Pseudomonadota bacterium]